VVAYGEQVTAFERRKTSNVSVSNEEGKVVTAYYSRPLRAPLYCVS